MKKMWDYDRRFPPETLVTNVLIYQSDLIFLIFPITLVKLTLKISKTFLS